MVRAGVVDHPKMWPFCGFKAKGKSITESKGHYQLRENVFNFGKTSTNGFEPAAGADAEMTNTFFWDDKP